MVGHVVQSLKRDPHRRGIPVGELLASVVTCPATGASRSYTIFGCSGSSVDQGDSRCHPFPTLHTAREVLR